MVIETTPITTVIEPITTIEFTTSETTTRTEPPEIQTKPNTTITQLLEFLKSSNSKNIVMISEVDKKFDKKTSVNSGQIFSHHNKY